LNKKLTNQESAERSQLLFGEKNVVISQIVYLAQGCAETGWDGDEAAPIAEAGFSLPC
jgi:hypothetical protein